jgi:hypothetical protein
MPAPHLPPPSKCENLLFIFWFCILLSTIQQYSMKVPPFATKLCVFSLLFYTALHVSAYQQAIIRCYLTNYKKVKLLNFTPWIH